MGGLAGGISGSLSSYFGSLEDGIGGVLTRDQLAKVMGGKATNAELRAIMRAVDLNGDGVISGLENVIIAEMPTDSILGTALRNKMNELDKNQLTHAQIRTALSPIATDAEIDRLIREVDVNGDGIVTRQELTNKRVGGLAGGIAKSLNPAFDMLDGNLDGKLTFAELSKGLDGIATDQQLRRIVRAVDLNADGVISGLESVVIAGMPTDSILAGVLTKESKRLGKEQLTQAEVRAALKGLATDGQINSLLNKTDVNGHRIWSRQGATNSRLAGLAKGIGSALSPMFSDIDTSLDGLIDYKEFSKAFSGMATDKELRNIFGKLDEDGSGTIDRLEALARTGEGTEDNTKSLEERAYDQLASLNGLVGEMSRTTDQFVGLNSNIVSLKDSINALGVAQADIARIERERKGAEIAAQAGMTLDRRNQQLGERGAVRGEIDRINDAYKGINMGQVKYRAQLDLKDGLDGWHTAKDGNQANWEGWESDFDRFVGTLRDANLGAMSQSEFDKWVAQREKQSKGMWSATHVETVAERVRSQEILRRHSIEMAQLDSLRERLENANSLISSFNDSIVQSRRDYKEATGKAAPFAKGGVFEMGRVATNSIVSSPTLFDMGLMGEADPEAIVPLSRGDGGRLGVDATGLMRIPDGPLELPMPDMPLPQFPQLGSNDVLQVLQDVKRELQESRKENKRLQEENNRHAAAAVAVQQAGFNGQINEQKKSNAALGTMASKARLEGARR
ncbi:EF-hand domain-containing protein [Halomonas qaidamensis]|uniref:EF-hand domain-containing protein n=1 Tax=Halomonas qaidamensis TaxID=2866211 RepID=UPI0038737CF7